MKRPLRILFVSRYPIEFHYFKSIIVAFLERGAEVKIIFGRPKRADKALQIQVVEDFCRDFAKCTYAYSIVRYDFWWKILARTREMLNYRRYLVVTGQSGYYKDRVLSYSPKWFKKLASTRLGSLIIKSVFFRLTLTTIEKIAPAYDGIVKDIKSFDPDAVLSSPVNMRSAVGVSDLEYLKAAVAMKIPSIVPVHSWDNLTNKGLIHISPDRLLVWNEAQREEAIRIHRIDADRIKITGSPLFDSWYAFLGEHSERDHFCHKFGLDPERPIVTYLGSSVNLGSSAAVDESWLVEKIYSLLLPWKADTPIPQLIVRPHPSHYELYRNLPDGITLVPPVGSMPNTESTLRLFADTLYHSVCTIGVNTSAMIDAIVAGRPGIAIITPEFAKTQIKTVHFRHLIKSGALELANPNEELPLAVKKLIGGGDNRKGKREEFIRKFIRPRGLGVSAGSVVADEVADLIRSTEYE